MWRLRLPLIQLGFNRICKERGGVEERVREGEGDPRKQTKMEGVMYIVKEEK